MTKVRDILTDALGEIGVLADSEAMDAGMAAKALRNLNRMIQTWNTEDLMVYTKGPSTFTLVPGQQAYTLGIGGNLVTTLPVLNGQIDMASVLVNGVEIPISILNDEQWRDVTLKTVTSPFPLMMWPTGNQPLNSLYFWPIPTSVYSLLLYLWGQTSTFASVNADVVFPQGYEDALVYNLAVRLASAYQLQPNPATVAHAAAAKSRIKRMNWEPSYRSVESAIGGSNNNIGQRSRGYVVD